MKFCEAHWDALRSAIDAEGVSHLVAKDGAAASRAMAREIAGTAGPDDFDPLMAAHWLIVGAASDRLGALNVMTDAVDPCPMCAVQKSHNVTCIDADCTWRADRTWIPGAAHDAADRARTLLRTGDAS